MLWTSSAICQVIVNILLSKNCKSKSVLVHQPWQEEYIMSLIYQIKTVKHVGYKLSTPTILFTLVSGQWMI